MSEEYLVSPWESVDAEEYAAVLDHLDSRQRGLLRGAANYHALVNPGEILAMEVYVGTPADYPKLTDVSTVTGAWIDEPPIPNRIGAFRIRSFIPGTRRLEPFTDENAGVLRVGGSCRYIRISPTVDNDAEARMSGDLRMAQKIYNGLERRQTLLLDGIREAMILRREKALRRKMPPMPDTWESEGEYARGKLSYPVVTPEATAPGAPSAIIIGMHWLQTGGAERWAFETISIAKDAGLLPIVITDQPSHQYWISRAELDGCLVLPLTLPLERWYGDEPLLRALVENYDVRGVIIHHCAWLYSKLPWLKHNRPSVPVVDSLHIIEYKGAGYPGFGSTHDEFIDTHHVISPQLERWLVQDQKVTKDKVAMAPLSGLTTDADSDFKPRSSESTFTVAFVGRLARQKRPDVFLALAQRLHRHHPELRFIMHGSGEMQPLVEKQLEDRGLSDVVERRDESTPVSDTLKDADLLLLTSVNEGLALTVFEAVSAGVPVVSTDVGSQATLVPESGLLRRSARAMFRDAERIITRLESDESARRNLWEREREAALALAEKESASEWARRWMEGLTEDD